MLIIAMTIKTEMIDIQYKKIIKVINGETNNSTIILSAIHVTVVG